MLALATCIRSKSNRVCLFFTEFDKNPEKQTKFKGIPLVRAGDTPYLLQYEFAGVEQKPGFDYVKPQVKRFGYFFPSMF